MKFSWLSLLLLLCGSLFFGCSESDTDTAASDAPTSDSLGTPTAPDTSGITDEPVAVDPVIVGLADDFEDLPSEFAEIKTAYETTPADSDAVGTYVGTLAQIGMLQQQRGNQDAADQACVRASEILTKALAADVESPLLALAPDVFYNHACFLDKQGKAKEALDKTALPADVIARLRAENDPLRFLQIIAAAAEAQYGSPETDAPEAPTAADAATDPATR